MRILYGLLRCYGNGRLQSAWKIAGFKLLRRGMYLNPKLWGFAPRHGWSPFDFSTKGLL